MVLGHREIFPLKVYYADTDCAGIVYYGTYMRWMEMGRCEFFNQHGIALSGQHEDGILVVARANLTYQKPARLGELLHMVVWVTEVTGLSFKFNYQFVRPNAEEETLLVEAHTLMLCVDSRDFRFQPLPQKVNLVLKSAE